jgi:alanine racemase
MQKSKFITKSWIEISKKSIFSNIDSFRKVIGKKVKIAAVIKANAYGHDLRTIVSVIKDKVDLFAVDSIYEAIAAKSVAQDKKVVVLGYIPLEDVKLAIKNDISFVCYNTQTIKKIISLNNKKVAKIHIKIETGTNRQGLEINEAISFAKKINKYKNKIIIEGIYTHFANIEDTLDSSFAMLQLKKFERAIAQFEKKIGKLDYYHCAASSAIILYPATHFNLVRLGISLYGLWPSKEVKIVNSKSNKTLDLHPVLTWKSVVAQVKYIEKGDTVSYGRTWTASRKTKIAVIPVGYFDGFDRKLSNNGRVLINGSYAPVIGRIAMNMFMVDVSEIKNVHVEDEVVIIGKQKGKLITADEIADKIGTINYEVVCRINPLLSRIVI